MRDMFISSIRDRLPRLQRQRYLQRTMKNKNRYTDVMDVGFNDDIMERETQSDVMVAPEPFLVVKNRGQNTANT